jgi:lysozyme family protein
MKINDNTFRKAVSVILQHEGGYVNDPDDPGGETNYGISKRSFPKLDIKSLTKDLAEMIYYKYFWAPSNFHLLEDELLVLHVFDHGVNCGRKRAIKMLQSLVSVKRDGIIGPLTAKAVNNAINIQSRFLMCRIQYYTGLCAKNPKLYKFLNGWKERVLTTHY